MKNDMENDEMVVPSAPGWPVLLVRKRSSSLSMLQGPIVERGTKPIVVRLSGGGGQCLALRQTIIGRVVIHD